MIKWHTGNEGNRNEASDLLYGLIVQRQIKSQAITIAAVATLIPTTPISYRKSLVIFNNADNVVYIGASDVTTANGYPLYPRASIGIAIEDNVNVYGISSAGGDVIRILEGA